MLELGNYYIKNIKDIKTANKYYEECYKVKKLIYGYDSP